MKPAAAAAASTAPKSAVVTPALAVTAKPAAPATVASITKAKKQPTVAALNPTPKLPTKPVPMQIPTLPGSATTIHAVDPKAKKKSEPLQIPKPIVTVTTKSSLRDYRRPKNYRPVDMTSTASPSTGPAAARNSLAGIVPQTTQQIYQVSTMISSTFPLLNIVGFKNI